VALSGLEMLGVALGVAAGAAVFAWAVWAATRARRGGTGGAGLPLCDTCTINDARYCSRPERPEATTCPDYKGPPR
jgi:hypothetical protein